MKEDEKSLPKYSVLAEELTRKIADGTFREGDRLPSENELCRSYGYSRQTVRQALGLLENKGLLSRRRGSGTFVRGAARAPGTGTVGVIATYITDYIFPSIIRGIESELTRLGYSITLGVTKNRVENESRILRSFLEKKVDGIIVEGTRTAFPNPNVPLYEKLTENRIPFVFFNGFYRELPCVHIVTDDRACGKAAALRLLKGKPGRKLGGIFKSDDLQGLERHAGFEEGIRSCGGDPGGGSVVWFTTAQREGLFSGGSGDAVLAKLKGCSGIVCYNDQIAFGLIRLLLHKGFRVPGDVAVIGFDEAGLSEYSPVRITTFRHPKEKMGVLAADKIDRLIRDPFCGEKSSVMKMEMIVKESTE